MTDMGEIKRFSLGHGVTVAFIGARDDFKIIIHQKFSGERKKHRETALSHSQDRKLYLGMSALVELGFFDLTDPDKPF